MKTSQVQSTYSNELTLQFGPNWASYNAVEELEWAADSIALDYLSTDCNQIVIQSLTRDRSPENAASVAVDAVLHAIKVIETAGGLIGSKPAKQILKKAVKSVMEIVQVIENPNAAIGVILEPIRFTTRRVRHIAMKLYQAQWGTG